MNRKPHPTRIGLFLLGGLALLVAALVVVSGGRLFSQRERAVAHFEGSVYGLQLGAPVVFRGVRLGSVTSIGVVYHGQPGRFAIPVEMEIERSAIASAGAGDDRHGRGPVSVADLVQQGLRARLSTQSLLTGLLYVDLDLTPPSKATKLTPAPPALPPPRSDGVTEIPTIDSPIQALQKQLENIDLQALAGDISAAVASTRQLVADPKLKQAVDELAQTGVELRRLVAALNQRAGPLADETRAALAAARRTADRWTGAAHGFDRATDSVSGTMGRVDRLADSAQPALDSVRQAADDLAQTSAALRRAGADDSSLMQQLERSAQDIARASRAVRDLADLLQRQPEALIRGKAATPP